MKDYHLHIEYYSHLQGARGNNGEALGSQPGRTKPGRTRKNKTQREIPLFNFSYITPLNNYLRALLWKITPSHFCWHLNCREE